MHIFIDTYKVKLEVEHEMFILSDGEQVRKISPYKIRSINIIKHCTLTSYALMHAAKHEIPVLIYGSKGRVEVWCWSHKYGTIADVRVSQALYSRDESRIDWIKELLHLKTMEQTSMLMWIKNRKSKVSKKVEEVLNAFQKMNGQIDQADSMQALRGIEGMLSRHYWEIVFEAYQNLTKASRRIKRYADDELNMSINYGYGILYGMVEASLVMNGLDPYIGLFHINRHDKPALAFDHIEPFRPWVDKLVLTLLSQVSEETTIIEENEMGETMLTMAYRRMLIEAFFTMIEERAYLGGHRIKRSDHIHHLSQRLVTLLKKKVAKDDSATDLL